MQIIAIIVAIFILLYVPLLRCFIFNMHNVIIYGFKDIIMYLIKRKWNDFNFYGIDMYIGMFGKGKTLAMTHKANQLYLKYGDKIKFISNYKLTNIPYQPLVNFQQLVELENDITDKEHLGTVVLIDEISTVLSHRNYSSFPLELLGILCQPRKKGVYMMCTAQRFFMVDKLFRSLCHNVYNCGKLWRFQRIDVFDAWDYEQAVNSNLIKTISKDCFFIKDKDYNAYDTMESITRNKASDFISNEETLVRKALDSPTVSNIDGVRKLKKNKKIYRDRR